jgi:hypothetical protein
LAHRLRRVKRLKPVKIGSIDSISKKWSKIVRKLLFAALWIGACKNDPEEEAWRPDLACPGDSSGICEHTEGPLLAGTGMRSIVPTCFESWTDTDNDGEYRTTVGDSFLDCGCDRLCPGDEGYSTPDEGEGDGIFQAVWLAGFGTGRPAASVHDPIWARAVVFDQGQTRLGIVALDLVGWFNDDVEATRVLAASAGLDIDYLLIATTHQHEGPDTVGMWGKRIGKTGYQEDYAAFIRQSTVDALADAVAGLREVGAMKVGHVDSRTYSEKGTRNLLRDSRDPVVIDERVNAALFTDKKGETITTLVNWANHPEVLADENTALTSDYSHYLREGMENGVVWEGGERPGLGGMNLYLNGAVGGLITPLGITVTDLAGVDHSASTFEKAEALGQVVADMALDAIADGDTIENPQLAFEQVVLKLPIDNWGFQAMFLSGVLDRETYDWDDSQIITETNVPQLRTEIARIQIGPLRMLSVPGELFPELAFGGFDGSKIGSESDTLIDENNPLPPQLDKAPKGPYWAELLESEHNWILGLGNDELGYIIPEYDFVISQDSPYIDQAEGDHYEETNSLGPATAVLLDEAVRTLLSWQPNSED